MVLTPDFFVQDDADARRAQSHWMQEQLGLGMAFFSAVLGCEAKSLQMWRAGERPLSSDEVARLDALWGLVRHLLSYSGFDNERVRALFEVVVERSPSPLAPPWQGTTLRRYLARGSDAAIDEALRWVTGLRFGDAYRPASSVVPWGADADPEGLAVG